MPSTATGPGSGSAGAAPPQAIAPLVAALHGTGRLRVWSLVVSALGDGAEPRGGYMASARLSALLERVEVNAGALRAALSRLARDGWLERRREGRTSAYRLSRSRRSEAEAASRLIYAPPRSAPVAAWVLEVGRRPAPTRTLEAGGGALLWPADAAPAPDAQAVRVTGALSLPGPLPLPEAMLRARAEMRADLASLPPGLAATLEPMTAMAARLLLVHRWRRLALRHPDLPPELDTPGARDMRGEMAAAYRALLPASESWLDTATEAFPAMPSPTPAVAARFRDM